MTRDSNITLLRPAQLAGLPDMARLAEATPSALADAISLAEAVDVLRAATGPAQAEPPPPPLMFGGGGPGDGSVGGDGDPPRRPGPVCAGWTVQAMIGEARNKMAFAVRDNAEFLIDIRTENALWAADPAAYGLDARQAHLAREIEAALAKASALLGALAVSLNPPALPQEATQP